MSNTEKISMKSRVNTIAAIWLGASGASAAMAVVSKDLKGTAIVIAILAVCAFVATGVVALLADHDAGSQGWVVVPSDMYVAQAEDGSFRFFINVPGRAKPTIVILDDGNARSLRDALTACLGDTAPATRS